MRRRAMNKIKALLERYSEIIMYIAVGGCTTAVNWIVYTALVNGAGVGLTLGNAAAWSVSVVFAFFANKFLVFESRKSDTKTVVSEAVSFLSARSVSGIIEIFIPKLLYNAGLDMQLLGIDGGIAKLSVSAAVIVLNYLFSKLVIFKKSKKGGKV